MHGTERPYFIGLLLGLCCFAGMAGCKTPRQAIRPAALIVVDQLDAHEHQLDLQINAEDEYYRGLTRVLVEDARREIILEQGNALISSVDGFADRILLESRGVPVGLTVQFLKSTDESFNGLLTANMQNEAEAKARAAATFAKIAYRREKIASARDTLLAAIRPQDIQEQAKWWADYGKRVKKELDALNAATTKPVTTGTP